MRSPRFCRIRRKWVLFAHQLIFAMGKKHGAYSFFHEKLISSSMKDVDAWTPEESIKAWLYRANAVQADLIPEEDGEISRCARAEP